MLNNIQIIGRVGRDAESRTFPNGDAAASFSVATTEKWKDKQTGESKEATEWHNVDLTGKLAEVLPGMIVKGRLVYVQGSIKTRKYTSRDGIEKTMTGIKAQTVQLLDRREDGIQSPLQQAAKLRQQPHQPQRQSAPVANSSGFDDIDDDIPF